MEKPKRTKIMYVNNAEFYQEIVKYRKKLKEARDSGREDPRIPDTIGLAIWKIAEKLSTKPCFVSYSFREEMIADGVENCFHRSTKVMTIEHGPIEIEKIIGKEVTIKTKDGTWKKATVKSYGKQMLYEYGFGARNKQNKNIVQTVICTKDHRWFVRCRLDDKKMFDWKNEIVTDLRIGDMLENSNSNEEKDKNAIIHGIIFGDGSVKIKTKYDKGNIIRQGKNYAFMRVCKKDFVANEIISLFDEQGYKCTYPKSANGDPVYYFGKYPFCKEVPFTNDPTYIAGFIYGWWLADGTKKTKDGMLSISTTNEDAALWLKEYAAYAGYHILSFRKKENNRNGNFTNGKPLFIINLGHDKYYKPRVKYIKEYGVDEVFCLEEPVTKSFVLANGLLTGNCILYFKDYDPDWGQAANPDYVPNPFAYFTQVIYYAFLRRINKEERNRYTIYKNFQEVMCNNSDMNLLVDGEDNHLMPSQMYDNINVFMKKFEEKEEKKKQKRKAVKEGLTKFIEENDE